MIDSWLADDFNIGNFVDDEYRGTGGYGLGAYGSQGSDGAGSPYHYEGQEYA